MQIYAYTRETKTDSNVEHASATNYHDQTDVNRSTPSTHKAIIPSAHFITARTLRKVLMNRQTCTSFHEASNKVETMQTNSQTVSSTPREQTITDAGSLVCICKQLQRKKHFLLIRNYCFVKLLLSIF